MYRWLGVLSLLFLWSCASSKLVLQQPLNEQCQGLSLKGCPELTDGVLAYVDGDRATGDAKLEAAVEANGPGRMREFAEKLRQLEELPGSDSFMGPIRQIIAKLEGGEDASPASDEAPETPIVRPKGRLASTGRSQVSADDDDDEDEDEPVSRRPSPYTSQKAAASVEPMASDAAHYLSGTIMATSDTTGGRCETPLTGLSGVGDRSLCTKAVAGPMVLTDLYAGGSCPAEVYLVVGDFSAIRLVLPIPARTPLHQTGARISIGPLEHLSVVAIKRSESDDPRCAVTWSAWKP